MPQTALKGRTRIIWCLERYPRLYTRVHQPAGTQIGAPYSLRYEVEIARSGWVSIGGLVRCTLSLYLCGLWRLMLELNDGAPIRYRCLGHACRAAR
jgi:hypothetical protein